MAPCVHISSPPRPPWDSLVGIGGKRILIDCNILRTRIYLYAAKTTVETTVWLTLYWDITFKIRNERRFYLPEVQCAFEFRLTMNGDSVCKCVHLPRLCSTEICHDPFLTMILLKVQHELLSKMYLIAPGILRKDSELHQKYFIWDLRNIGRVDTYKI